MLFHCVLLTVGYAHPIGIFSGCAKDSYGPAMAKFQGALIFLDLVGYYG